jgi:hypothetical protein
MNIPKPRITLTVGPLGHDFSVMRNDAYYGRYPSRTKATQAAEAEAAELRREGYEVTCPTGEQRVKSKPVCLRFVIFVLPPFSLKR